MQFVERHSCYRMNPIEKAFQSWQGRQPKPAWSKEVYKKPFPLNLLPALSGKCGTDNVRPFIMSCDIDRSTPFLKHILWHSFHLDMPLNLRRKESPRLIQRLPLPATCKAQFDAMYKSWLERVWSAKTQTATLCRSFLTACRHLLAIHSRHRPDIGLLNNHCRITIADDTYLSPSFSFESQKLLRLPSHQWFDIYREVG